MGLEFDRYAVQQLLCALYQIHIQISFDERTQHGCSTIATSSTLDLTMERNGKMDMMSRVREFGDLLWVKGNVRGLMEFTVKSRIGI